MERELFFRPLLYSLVYESVEVFPLIGEKSTTAAQSASILEYTSSIVTVSDSSQRNGGTSGQLSQSHIFTESETSIQIAVDCLV